MAMAVAPPTVTMMTMVIIPVTIIAMVIIPVVNHRAKIVLGSGFADWRDGSGEGARHWSYSKKTAAKCSSRESQFCFVHEHFLHRCIYALRYAA